MTVLTVVIVEPSWSYVDALRRFEAEYMAALLESVQQNMSEASRVSGLNRSTLYRIRDRCQPVK